MKNVIFARGLHVSLVPRSFHKGDGRKRGSDETSTTHKGRTQHEGTNKGKQDKLQSMDVAGRDGRGRSDPHSLRCMWKEAS